ncbi:glycoside hydrolase family 16 protein [Aurantiacibacter aquimixticola]|uniref:Glycoside hydrolase family 16 protein n=2 Tax=Aurantiacibacter aquimixticola TaxID=1958945 RepID=A0A419RVR3_9SPHN|nr:glycoside hydrolase family 16 protein [Aurantiacibacter aquimixticola]
MLTACGGSDTPPTPRAAPVVDASGEWQLVWQDEFTGDTLDPAWNRIEDCWGGGNDERQCYTGRAANIALENGVLVLTARQESYTGDAWPDHMKPGRDDPDAQKTQDFTSGKLTTEGNRSWTYGRFEIRARLPQGQGVWPAFWMLPEDSGEGWPVSGEIDILEAVNLGVECEECEAGGENSVLGTLHYGARPSGNEYTNRKISYPAVLDDQFHTFGVIWEEGRFTWTLDGEPYGTLTAEDWWTSASNDPNAPFDHPFHLILNLAIGGNWPENTSLRGVSTEGFPKQLEVDWVRVWQCDADPATGRGCL